MADLAPLGPLGYFCSRGPIHIVANRVATAIWGIVLGITFEQSRQLETVFPHRVYRDINMIGPLRITINIRYLCNIFVLGLQYFKNNQKMG